MLTVCGNHGHLQPRNADVEIAHGRAVDKAQTEFLARFENTSPVTVGCLAIHEIGIGIRADIAEVSRTHVHLSPHLSICYRRRPTFAADIVYEVSDGALVMVVIARLFLEFRHNVAGIFVGPVSQHHHVVAIVLKRFRFFRIDDDWTVNACLLLQTRVAVIPVGSVLMKLEFVFVHAIGCDAMEAQARHTVHVGG